MCNSNYYQEGEARSLGDKGYQDLCAKARAALRASANRVANAVGVKLEITKSHNIGNTKSESQVYCSLTGTGA